MNNKYTLAQLAAIYTTYKDLDFNTKTVNCCTCGKSMHINSVEDCFNIWGHYIPRSKEPKLKFHPNNTFSQCPQCNMQFSQEINKAYDNYIIYRFGKDIKEELQKDSSFADVKYATSFYINKLLELAQQFNELYTVVVNTETGEFFDKVDIIEDPIVEQWNTFSINYKQDLDTLTKLLNTEPIEYERF